jgi:hypothetical protein
MLITENAEISLYKLFFTKNIECEENSVTSDINSIKNYSRKIFAIEI